MLCIIINDLRPLLITNNNTKMRRKTNFKQMFLVDSTLYKRVNTSTSLTTLPAVVPTTFVSEIHTPIHESPPTTGRISLNGETAGDDTFFENTSTQTENDEEIKQSVPLRKDEKLYNAKNPIIKALKEHHEQVNESSEPPTKKTRYEQNDKEIDYNQMIQEIDEEINILSGFRKDAMKMRIKSGRQREKKKTKYVQYFVGSDGSEEDNETREDDDDDEDGGDDNEGDSGGDDDDDEYNSYGNRLF